MHMHSYEPSQSPADVARPLDEVLDQLWITLGHRRGEAVPREELRALARVVSREARSRAMLPEQLVVAVKESWTRHPKLRDAYSRHEALGTLADVVALCITEYFRGSDGAVHRVD